MPFQQSISVFLHNNNPLITNYLLWCSINGNGGGKNEIQSKIYALLHTWSSGVPFHSKVTTLKHFRSERCCGLKARRKDEVNSLLSVLVKYNSFYIIKLN